MQKKLIALAIAGLASSAAFAADNVTIYGRLDYGFMARSGNSGGVQNAETKNEFGSGLQAGSRLGFRGAEELGNGLKAIFEVEFGTAVDQIAGTLNATGAAANGSTAATWVNRHSYVGLTGGFGTVVGGRLDGVRYGIFNKYDPFAGGTVGNFTHMSKGQVDRADNAIAYISPNFSGFTGTLAYSTNISGAEGANGGYTGAAVAAAPGNHNDLRLHTFMVNYANGPIDLTADAEQVKSEDSNNGLDLKVRVYTLAGSYDFGVAKVSALYDWHKVDLNGSEVADDRAWFLGAKIPFAGKFAAKVNYGRSEDKKSSNADANKWALGVDYALSKRTNFYADYGSIHNDTNAAFRITPAANGTAFQAGTGLATSAIGVRGFDIGIAHNF